MPYDNDGNKYVGTNGSLSMDTEGGTPADIAHVVSFTLTETAVDVDQSELGSAWQDGDLGQKSFAGDIVIRRSVASALLRTGRYDAEFMFDNDAGGTAGKIAGTFRIQSVGLPIAANQSVIYNARAISCGTVTITEATAS